MNQTTEATKTNKNDIGDFQPEVSNAYKILDILYRNPIKCSFKTIQKHYDMSDAAIRSAIKRLREKRGRTHNFHLRNKLITTKIRGKKPTIEDIKQNIIDGNNNIDPRTAPRGPRTIDNGNFNTSIRIFELLEKNPEGIKITDLMNELNLKKQSIYGSIYLLRRKGYKIKTKFDKYKLINSEPKNKIDKTSQYNFEYKNNEVQQRKSNNNGLIPTEYLKDFENLPENDKLECINLLKKSLYYKKSALSLLESNQMAFELCQNLIEGENL